MPDKEFIQKWVCYAKNDMISVRILFDNSCQELDTIKKRRG
jgi:hypothetical protein